MTLSKSEYSDLITSRLKSFIDSRRISQLDVVKLCQEKGYQISQSTLSKILNGTTTIQTYHISIICDALNINLSEVFSLDENVTITNTQTYSPSIDDGLFITDASRREFQGYLGTFHAYFFPTKSNEDELIHGLFTLYSDSETHQCMADLKFNTGRYDINKNLIIKQYSGQASLSIPMQTIYCNLKCSVIGEITYLLYHYHYIAYEQLECRLATVITSSAGSKRIPTTQRLLFTRKELTDQQLYILSGQLLLNSSEILISETAYRQFLKDPYLPNSFREYFGDDIQEKFGLIASVPKIPYYYFDESIIRDSFLPAIDRQEIICLLRKYSASQRYNKISDKSDEIIYKYLSYSNAKKDSRISDNSTEPINFDEQPM